MNPGAGDSGGDDGASDGRKGGKRELSTSKRAAQNRAAQVCSALRSRCSFTEVAWQANSCAKLFGGYQVQLTNILLQRAFRQRKEGHIKTLETQVREFNSLSENYKALQSENYQLRDYIISLQSRLLESQGEYPQPPSNIDIPHPRTSGPPPQQIPAPTAPMGSSAASQLQASAAQAVADMSGGRQQKDESPYSRGNNTNKRTRVGEDTELRSAPSQPPLADIRQSTV